MSIVPDRWATLKIDAEPTPTDALVAALVATLEQLRELLGGLSDEQFTCKPGGALVSSIGGHVRHNLDHVSALLRGLNSGAIDYDQRERGTRIETDRSLTLATILRLIHELESINWLETPNAVRLSIVVAADRAPIELLTNPERELAFVVSHTIHHNALIAVIVAAVGAVAPAGFGYAPSTLAYQRGPSCVR